MSDGADDVIDAESPALRGRLGRDLFWAYAAAGAKVASWVVVSGLVFRRLGAVELGMLALVRATVGLLSYAGLGLAPALVHRMSKALASAVPGQAAAQPERASRILSYSGPRQLPTRAAYSNGLTIALASALVVLPLLQCYARYFGTIHGIDADPQRIDDSARLANLIGLGVFLRIVSDVPGAVLQTTGRIWLDYAIITTAEGAWTALTCFIALSGVVHFSLHYVGFNFFLASLLILIARWLFAGSIQGSFLIDSALVNRQEVGLLLGFGFTVLVSQFADYLYAPMAMILIQHLLGATAVAHYTPAVQIDAGLLLLVSGLAAVALPRAAAAHAGDDITSLRRYYVRATGVSLVLLATVASLVWAVSPAILRLWLGHDLPPTRAILPLVLASTVIGGSAGVGRSVLLGIGKVKAYTTAALLAGILNVVASYSLAKYAGLGLRGIALGTLCVVVVRCAIWMPWYVLRVTRSAGRN